MPASRPVPAAGYLDGLAALAGRGFASSEEALAAILRLVVGQLGLRSSYLTRLSPEEQRSEVLVAYNAPGGCDIRAGAGVRTQCLR